MTITLTREEAQQVLDALECMNEGALNAEIKLLRARLSAPEPEPVAWMNESDIGRTDWKVWAHGKPTATMPLYTAPPQPEPEPQEVIAKWIKTNTEHREWYICPKCSHQTPRFKDEWQGLTDEEKNAITWGKTVYEILDLAEAKLKEKNA